MDINPDKILLQLIPEEELERVLSSDASAEICTEHLCCCTDTYYYLSQMIPKDFTVIDFGCGYNAQSYFFAGHKKFIAVEPSMKESKHFHVEQFKAPNCEMYEMTTGQFLTKVDYPKEKVFAICNYVPNWYWEDSIKLVRQNFRNVFTFYPESDIKINGIINKNIKQ